jgi:hypothetical protein
MTGVNAPGDAASTMILAARRISNRTAQFERGA